MSAIKLSLPEPHAAQKRIIDEAKRFNVLDCGRRFGKTILGMDRLIHPALRGLPTAWFAPSYKMLDDAWRDVRTMLLPVTVRSNASTHRLELISGGSIDMWSLEDSDVARGRKYKLVVIDEAAVVKELAIAWQLVIRPTLTDLEGDCWFMSTPKGLNFFKTLFDHGQDPMRPEWASWQMPTSANPFINPAEIEAARQDMTESGFRQEYLADFISGEGAVFRRILEAATAEEKESPEPGHTYVMGADWGRSVDYTVFSVMDATTRAQVALDRSNKVDYVLQRARLEALCQRWQPVAILAEENNIGQPIIEQLLRDGLPVYSFTTTNASKAQMIERLALAFERGEITILPDPVQLAELQAYRAEQLPSGMVRYSAPGGGHDDTVIALGLAWMVVTETLQSEQAPTMVYFNGDTGAMQLTPWEGVHTGPRI